MLIRPLHDQFQDDGQGWLCCLAHRLLPLPVHPWNSPLKALVPWWAVSSWFFGMWVHLLPRIAVFFQKAIFPSTQHLSFNIGFLSNEQWNLSSLTLLCHTRRPKEHILLMKCKILFNNRMEAAHNQIANNPEIPVDKGYPLRSAETNGSHALSYGLSQGRGRESRQAHGASPAEIRGQGSH